MKPFVNEDNVVLEIIPDGACGFNAPSAHIFEDQKEGQKLWHVINVHIVDQWSFYSNIVTVPYRRQTGVSGEWVDFKEV